jgi:hypothetical protein
MLDNIYFSTTSGSRTHDVKVQWALYDRGLTQRAKLNIRLELGFPFLVWFSCGRVRRGATRYSSH